MSRTLEVIRQIVTRDLGAEFVRSMSIEIGWSYAQLHDELAADTELPHSLKVEQFGLRRGAAVVAAMVRACRQHGVPFNFRELECNGQSKLLVKAGRVVLIQEPMLSLADLPRTSDYKVGLADVHGVIRQLEFELGDQARRITDWSGCVLAVVLHGARGSSFSPESKMLGGLLLAVPNAAYDDWVMRVDLRNVALFGDQTVTSPAPHAQSSRQQDLVSIRRRGGRITGTEE